MRDVCPDKTFFASDLYRSTFAPFGINHPVDRPPRSPQRSVFIAEPVSQGPRRLVHRRRQATPEARELSPVQRGLRSEEHTSELQSLMRISYAVFCLKKKKQNTLEQAKTKKTTHIKQSHKSRNQIT